MAFRRSGVRIPSGPPTFAHACQRARELRLASHATVVHRSPKGEGGRRHPSIPFSIRPQRARRLAFGSSPAGTNPLCRAGAVSAAKADPSYDTRTPSLSFGSAIRTEPTTREGCRAGATLAAGRKHRPSLRDSDLASVPETARVACELRESHRFGRDRRQVPRLAALKLCAAASDLCTC